MKTHLSVALGRLLVVLCISTVLVLGFTLIHQSPQRTVKASGGAPQGTPIAKLSALETTLFNSGYVVFNKTWSLAGGLGPVFTQANCSFCHGNPVAGGGSPPTDLRKDELFATTNSDGSFNNLASEGGPLLQQRGNGQFKPTCSILGEVIPTSPPFPTAATIFDKRLAPAALGMGLIDAIPDSAIQAEASAEQANRTWGISGQANTIYDEAGNLRPARFGYKAEAVDLLQFVTAALLGEVGITTPILQTEVPPQGGSIPPTCEGNAQEPVNDPTGTQMAATYQYLTYLAPNPFPQNPNTNGENQFNLIGCSVCHLPSYTTGPSVQVLKSWGPPQVYITSKALSNQTVMLYSDLLLHHMGGLADGFPSLDGNGNATMPAAATGDQFRTTPLWGLSLRANYLHDGRTNNLKTAILDHDLGTGSEAHQVILNFNAMQPQDQADLLTFIGSL
jgi:CxxC motif-containing protein (DUF1111 family)